jgi:two-component system phosphate regulon sensor histidine kinase PhoR
MDFWIVSSIVLFIALIGLAASLFYFYRQKFLAEIQKDFVNNFTHEFKTPLAVMKIASDVLSQESITRQPDRLERYVAIIQNQTEHLQAQVERLLRTASIETKDLPIRKEEIDAHLLIEEALNKVQPLIEQKKAGWKSGWTRATAACRQTGPISNWPWSTCWRMPSNIQQTRISSYRPVMMKTTSIFPSKTTGVGIEKQYLKNIFKKFYRVPTGDIHNVKGFGLGLNFVKRIIDAHKGKIKVNSLPGIGTEFRLFIPLN